MTTTYELTPYYAELKRLPRLCDEEQQHLLSTVVQPHPPQDANAPDDLQVKHRLIEGHLSFATYIAVHSCPPSRSHLLPDLVGAVNLSLVEAATRCDLSTTRDLTTYLASCMRGSVKRVLGDDLIRVPWRARSVARANGTLEELYALQPLSLDLAMQGFESGDLDEPLMSPILPREAAPPRDPALRAQVESWLALLSPRAQAVLCLRYGLGDDDERAHTVVETARALGLARQAVQSAERAALQRLKALALPPTSAGTVADESCTGLRKRSPSTSTRRRRFPALTQAEQEEQLMQTATRLHEQGSGVTLRRLARETGIPTYRVQDFLQTHRDRFAAVTQADKHQQSLSQVAQVYAQLIARGERVTSSKQLARAAHVRIDTALEFLRAERSQPDALA